MSNVDLDECESDPCENGGDCHNGNNAYSCRCMPGYTGTNCETGEQTLIFQNILKICIINYLRTMLWQWFIMSQRKHDIYCVSFVFRTRFNYYYFLLRLLSFRATVTYQLLLHVCQFPLESFLHHDFSFLQLNIYILLVK